MAIIDCEAPVETPKARIQAVARHRDNVSDADLGVLSRQLAVREAVDEDEADLVLGVQPDQRLDRDTLLAVVGPVESR